MTSKLHPLLEKFKKELCTSQEAAIFLQTIDWYPLSIGFFLGCGATLEAALRFANDARYKHYYWILFILAYLALSIPATHFNVRTFYGEVWKQTDLFGRICTVLIWPILLVCAAALAIIILTMMGLKWLCEQTKLSVVGKLYPKIK